MKKLAYLIVALVLAYGFAREQGVSIPGFSDTAPAGKSEVLQASSRQQSDVQVQGSGVVVKVLRDDLKGSRHQKFILKIAGGPSVLVAHNIDLAPRIDGLRAGDSVEFYGEYEWNAKGGVVHWTHRDPGRRHVDGWLKHDGRTFE
ncbi:DUF3465 domain-containing protein [Pseudomonas sp. S9]|uniref:DUF3465 domain-containing protein n=1 Tax=Pseudomonas sp. S9 TaxID=686578 RepID=UPI0002556CBD|nr:DUF3465 domain-containing protein [Pseudomonas sp. S9]